jgi:hypothetical protein
MPLAKYKLHRKSFEDSVNLNVASSIVIEPSMIISENNSKRQRIESPKQNIPSESTITIIKSTNNVDEQPPKKKTKTKTTIVPPVTQSIPDLSITQLTPEILKESIREEEMTSEPPLSLPSTNGRIHQLKSKTPAWKAQPPTPKGNAQSNNYNFFYYLILTYYRQNTCSIRF